MGNNAWLITYTCDNKSRINNGRGQSIMLLVCNWDNLDLGQQTINHQEYLSLTGMNYNML
jgi:hypothetical protein